MTATDAVADLLADAGMAGDPQLTAVLTDLRELASGPAPEPSPALAALLAGDPVADTAVLTALPMARERRRRRAAAGVSVLVLAAVASTGVAAAANQLPAGAQRLAVRFSQQFLPFSFPLPREDGPLTPGSPAPHGAGDHDPVRDGAAGADVGTPGGPTPGTAAPGRGTPGRHGDGRAGHRTGDAWSGHHHHHDGWTSTRRDRDGARHGDGDPRSTGDGSADRARPGDDGPGGDGSHRGSGSDASGGSDGSGGTSGPGTSDGSGGSDGSSTGDGGPDGSGTGSGGTSDDGGSDGGSSGGGGDGTDGGARLPDVTGALPQ